MTGDGRETLLASIEALREGVQVIGFDWTYRYVNRAAAAHGGSTPSQLLGRSMTECYPGIDQTPMFATLQRVMSTRRREELLNEFVQPSGARRWFDLVIDPVPGGICVLSVDVTERRIIERQFQQSQKMEAIGQLAGGVAHDFNNLLTAMLGYCDLLREQFPERDDRRADVEEIRRAAASAARLTASLLAFSSRQPIEPAPVDLNLAVTDMLGLLTRIIGEDIRVRTRLASDLKPILADAGQIHQVLMNLAVNARDAMPTGGELFIETGNVHLDAHYAQTHLAVVPGPYVMLAVTDTGIGMTPDVQARLFEPFFTTKERGKGTGLGLASVYGIVKQNKGNIWVYSEPGRGSTFKVYWPEASGAVSQRAVEPAPVREGLEGTVLVVDDNATVLTLVARVLGRQGHRVLTANTAAEASRLSEVNAGSIDLLLTDVVMPEIGGPELVATIQKANPDMRILFMSGFTAETVLRHGLTSGAAFIQKPFTPAELASKVQRVLSAREPQ